MVERDGQGSSDGVSIAAGGADRLDDLRILWLALHDHHRAVSALPLVEDDELSWRRRRERYRRWLERGEAFLLIAEVPGSAPVGYALVRLDDEPDDTWSVEGTSAEL
jgi:hypothetical protein